MNYHYNLQGLIYTLIKDTEYAYVHDKAGFKFFCFSNLIPITSPIVNGEIRTLVVSSPDISFISVLYEKMKMLDGLIKVGNMKFRFDSAQRLNLKVPETGSCTMITGTPIIIRIPWEKYKKYGISPPINYEYLYWRRDHPLEVFLSQLWDNLQRKYNEYFRIDNANQNLDSDIEPFSFFSKFIFRKQISTKLFIKNSEQIVIGTTWEFLFERPECRDITQFALDGRTGIFFPFKAIVVVFLFHSCSFFFLGLNSNSTPRLSL
jgi:CRISPR-associated endoribonuclease Cas6